MRIDNNKISSFLTPNLSINTAFNPMQNMAPFGTPSILSNIHPNFNQSYDMSKFNTTCFSPNLQK